MSSKIAFGEEVFFLKMNLHLEIFAALKIKSPAAPKIGAAGLSFLLFNCFE